MKEKKKNMIMNFALGKPPPYKIFQIFYGQ